MFFELLQITHIMFTQHCHSSHISNVFLIFTIFFHFCDQCLATMVSICIRHLLTFCSRLWFQLVFSTFFFIFSTIKLFLWSILIRIHLILVCYIIFFRFNTFYEHLCNVFRFVLNFWYVLSVLCLHKVNLNHNVW